MKRHIGIGKILLFLIIVITLFVLNSDVFARTHIRDILTKGSIWYLFVDGKDGELKLLGGQGSRTPDGGWKMTWEIKWQDTPGKLEAEADHGHNVYHVKLEVRERGEGPRHFCEGYVAQGTDNVMAGTTSEPYASIQIRGAWYAVKK